MKIHLNAFCVAVALLATAGGLLAAPGIVTYQGMVRDNGANFNGVGHFKFALNVPGRNAEAVVTLQKYMNTGFNTVSSIKVTDGGSGYTTAPSVTLLSDGLPFGATAAATVANGAVVAINLIQNGVVSGGITIAIGPPTGAGGTAWSNDGTSTNGSEPQSATLVTVSNGLFTVGLGDTNQISMNPLDLSVFADQNLRLQIWFADGANPSAPLNPAQTLTWSPYAAYAASAGQLTGGDNGSVQVDPNGYIRLNDAPIFLREGTDTNHGLAYTGSTITNFGGGSYQIDGPVLWGYSGGILGTREGGIDSAALIWSRNSVTVYGTFNNASDRNGKQDFKPITPAEVLKKVEQLPLSEWSYKTDAATRHIGPMAQDFHAAFAIGTDDKHIAPMDESGVALAAIQALSQELKAKDAEMQQLKQRLERLEQENARR
jgi:hypothetical protein